MKSGAGHRPGLPEDRHAFGHARPRRLRAREERQVYAVSMIVTDPDGGEATPALDSLVEWIARAG